jgi:hypothetical protein
VGITNIQFRQVKWLGQQWEEDEKPWQGLPILVDNQVTKLSEASIIISLGDSAKTSFWHDPWLDKHSVCLFFFRNDSVCLLSPDLFPHCTMRKLPVKHALEYNRWIRHLKRNLTTDAITQFTDIWERLLEVRLTPGVQYSIKWLWTADGKFSLLIKFSFKDGLDQAPQGTYGTPMRLLNDKYLCGWVLLESV